ncbi:MAG: hypothetical protein V4519_02935 [Patescibacteria group bacterium]
MKHDNRGFVAILILSAIAIAAVGGTYLIHTKSSTKVGNSVVQAPLATTSDQQIYASNTPSKAGQDKAATNTISTKVEVKTEIIPTTKPVQPSITIPQQAQTQTSSVQIKTESAPPQQTQTIQAEVKPSIEVISPNGGNMWKVGETYTVSYKISGINVDTNNTISVYIQRSNGSGSRIGQSVLIHESKVLDNGFTFTMNETLVNTLGMGSGYQIKVCIDGCKNYFDMSNDVFSVLQSTDKIAFVTSFTQNDGVNSTIKNLKWSTENTVYTKLKVSCNPAITIKYKDSNKIFYCDDLGPNDLTANGSTSLVFTSSSSEPVTLVAQLYAMAYSTQEASHSMKIQLIIPAGQ